MPFGLVNAPAIFSAIINDVFWEMLNKFVLVYLDNILISPVTTKNIFSMFHRSLLRHKLFVKLEKSEFHVSKVSFISFIVPNGSL